MSYEHVYQMIESFLIFLGLNALLFSTANTLVWRYFSHELRDVYDWIILFFVFAASEILLVLGVIGFLGQLHLPALIFGTVICFVVGGVRWPFLGIRFQLGSREAWKKLRQLRFRQEREDGEDFLWAIFGFLILFGAIELFNAFVQFPWEYDTIAYHMPIVVEWFQQGTLWEVFYAVWGGPLGYYPSNHELLLGWLILPFGNDLLVNTANFFFIGVMLVVISKILKEMGVKDFLSWLAGALVMVMPIFLRQMGTGQVDILMALGVILSWYFLLRSYRRHDGLLLIPLLLNLSILFGTKYLSLIYSLPILVVFFLMAKHWRRTHHYWWLWFLAILGTLGSMWYWRNLVITGNPIFPAELKIGGWMIFQGYTGLTERIQELSLWHRLLDGGQLQEWFVTMIKETGWHMYLVIMAYLLLVGEIMTKLFFGTLKRGEGKIYTLMLFFLPAYCYLYFITPYTASMMEHNVRYAMPWLMLAMIIVIYVVFKLGSARRPFVIALLGVIWWQFLSIVTAQRIGHQSFLELQFVQSHPWLFALMIASIIMAFLFVDGWQRRSGWRYPALALALILSCSFLNQAAVVRTDLRSISWQQKYDFPLMKAYQWLDEHVSSDAVIANTLNPLYYPLYGINLQRKVRYVNINSCTDCDYHDYQEQGMTLRDNPDEQQWLANLKFFGTQYLVLGYSIRDGLEKVEPYELEWVKNNPDAFQEVFRETEVVVYQFLPQKP